MGGRLERQLRLHRSSSTPGSKFKPRTDVARRRVARTETDGLQKAYRWMLVARRIDDTMWTLRRQGKGHFVVSSAGHEAIGAAAGLAATCTRTFWPRITAIWPPAWP